MQLTVLDTCLQTAKTKCCYGCNMHACAIREHACTYVWQASYSKAAQLHSHSFDSSKHIACFGGCVLLCHFDV
jgi:hypothetical protein